MNKEDVISKINNNTVSRKCSTSRSDCCDIEGQVFQNVILDHIECYRITFSNCKFVNVQFLNNKIEWIEFEECEFENTVFSGKYENVLMTIMESSFRKCEVRDFEFLGYDAQSELVRCQFDSCGFNNIKIEADLSIIGGKVVDSKVIDFSEKMNMIMNVKFSDTTFQNVHIQAAIIKNSFNKVEMNNINRDEECVIENNKFENCHIDSKLVEC